MAFSNDLGPTQITFGLHLIRDSTSHLYSAQLGSNSSMARKLLRLNFVMIESSWILFSSFQLEFDLALDLLMGLSLTEVGMVVF